MKTLVKLLPTTGANPIKDTVSPSLIPAGELKVRGGVYRSGYIDFKTDPANAIYLKHPSLFPAGIQFEAVVYFTEPIPDNGTILTKSGSIAIGFEGGKLKQEYLTGKGETANLSASQMQGTWVVPLNKKILLRWCYESARGLFTFEIDGCKEPLRYRVQGPADLASDGLTSAYQLFQNLKNFRVYSCTISEGAPTLAPVGFGVEIWQRGSTYDFGFRRVHSSLIGKAVKVRYESPYGAVTNLTPDVMNEFGSFRKEFEGEIPGDYTFFFQCAGIQVKKSVFWNKDMAAMPEEFVLGIYNVPIPDYAQIAAMGFNCVQVDWTCIHPGPWQDIDKHLQACRANGMKMLVRTAYHTKSTGNATFADNYPDVVLGNYVQDEYPNDMGRAQKNYWAMRCLRATQSNWLNLKDFQLLAPASECCDGIMVNTYFSVTQVYEICKKSASYKPTIAVLPQYQNVQKSLAEMNASAWAAICAGVVGIFWFEWDHSEKGVGWKTKDFPNLVQNLATVVGSLKAIEVDLAGQYTPVPTDNSQVVSCLRGSKTVIVNLSTLPQSTTISGQKVNLAGLQVIVQ